jgi:hypothetical protein
MNSSYAPFARIGHASVWTGTKMAVFGGGDNLGNFFNFGGEYDPVANVWTHTTTTGAPDPRWGVNAVWTGSQMMVLGGDTYITAGTPGQLYSTGFLLTP